MRSFASDNNSGVHPLVMEALVQANVDHALGYGDDQWTAAAEGIIRDIFGSNASPFFVFNGTGANCVALQSVTRPFDSIICAETAHIFADECGAPGRMSGCTLVAVPTPDGKLTPQNVLPHLKEFGVCHHPQPRVAYISQVTELGTAYTIAEVKALADLLHGYGMYLHMDGARLANACVTLGCSMKEITVEAGVDILSFGGTKNGMMMGEAVISFRDEISENLKFYRKMSAQLASKQRYLAAQYIPYLSNGLWYGNALNANKMGQKIANMLLRWPIFSLTQKVESNQVFFKGPKDLLDRLMEEYPFYYWNEAEGEARLVASWDTTDADIADLQAAIERLMK